MEDRGQVLPLARVAVERPAFGELAQLVALEGEGGGAVVAEGSERPGTGRKGVEVWHSGGGWRSREGEVGPDVQRSR